MEADAATTSTIISAFSEFGTQLPGGGLGFVNLTRTFVGGDLPVPFEPENAVLELLETVTIDDAVVRGARDRANEGYLLAMDDFVWTPEAAPLLEISEIVNAASSGLTRRLSSIRDAVVLVGMARLRAWMVLIAVGATAEGTHRISSALVRARTCELIAPRISPQARPDAAFTVGASS